MNSSAISFMRRAFLAHQPAGHALMRRSKIGAKYYRVYKPITDQQLADHLAGRITLACQQQTNGRAHIAAADFDRGGMPHLIALLERCALRGLWAFAIAVKADKHDGGHLFIPFAEEQDAGALKQLADELTGARETFPSGSDLRLPFGLHQREQTRGVLLLQDGTQHSLDSDLAGGLALLESRWHPNTGQLVGSSSTPREIPSTASGESSNRTLVRAILEEFDIEDRLDHYGARKGPGQCYYCPFHDDREPSLQVYRDQQGIAVCRCHSMLSACPLAEHRRNDVINVVAIGEGISISEATLLLAEELRRRHPPSSTSRPAPAPLSTEAPGQPLQPPSRTQPRTSQHVPSSTTPAPAHAAQRQQNALIQVMSDPRLPPCARATYAALNLTAGERGRCAPSVATLAIRSGQHDRSVKRGLRILERFGYIITQQRYGQTSRYILFWLSERMNEHGVIDRSPNMLDPDSDHACKGGHESHDPGALDFFAPGAVAKVPAQLAEAPISDDQPQQAQDLGGRPDENNTGEPFWTHERLCSFGRMRAGPPKPRPGRPQQRQKQARFVTLDGELPKRIASRPPGPLPAPTPIPAAQDTPRPAATSPDPPAARQRGKGTRRGCPPSQASMAFNPWKLPDDDPWIVQQRRALEGAEREGNAERIRFYRWVLDGVK